MSDSPNLIDRQKNAVENEELSVEKKATNSKNPLKLETPKRIIQAKTGFG